MYKRFGYQRVPRATKFLSGSSALVISIAVADRQCVMELEIISPVLPLMLEVSLHIQMLLLHHLLRIRLA